GLAAAVNALVRNPGKLDVMGRAGRVRAVRDFDWAAIATQTVELYQSVKRG
ncbi:MAG: glycogen synthase, partial [Actinobacteria bacterium]|nr:glycogen synthase [Actinomycetota bacterium]